MQTVFSLDRRLALGLLAAGLLSAAALLAPVPVEKPTWISGPRRAAFEPTACLDRSGRLWAAWISTNRAMNTTARLDVACLVDGAVVAQASLDDAGPLPAAPHLVARGDGVYAVWEAGPDGERRLLGRALELAAGAEAQLAPGDLEPIPTPAATPLVPRLAATEDGLLLVHQGLSGASYDLFLSSRDERGWSEARALTKTDVDEWNPRLAADAAGGVHLVWDFFDGSSFDVAYARIEDGALVDRQLVASGSDYQGYPELAVEPGGAAWIAWESCAQFGEQGGLRAERDLDLARIERVTEPDGGSRSALRHLPREALSADAKRREFPRPALTADGLLIGSTSPKRGDRKHDHLFTAWTLSLTSFEDGAASQRELPFTDGNSDPDYVLVPDPRGGTWLVFSADRRSEHFAEVVAWSDSIERRPRVAAVHLEARTGFPALASEPPPPRRSEPAAPAAAPAAGSGVLFGDLHRHTHLSRCSGAKDGTILDAYRYARGPGGLDFVAITDHFQHMRSWSWLRSKRDAIRYHAPGSLVVFAGVERVRAGRGHYNDVYLDPQEPAFDTETWLRPPARFAPAVPEHVISIPHMMSIDDGTGFDWDEFDEDRTRLFEIYQGKRGSYEGRDLPFEADDGVEQEVALARGFERGAHFGLVAASDHVSSSTSFAGLHAMELTRAAVFQALRERRSFASTVARPLDARLGELAMGEAGDPVTGAAFTVLLPGRSGEELAYVELVKNGHTAARLAGASDTESWVVTLRRAPLKSLGALTVELEGGTIEGALPRRAGSPGLRLALVEPERVRLVRTEFIQVDLALTLRWNPAASEQALVFVSGDVRVRVPRESVEPGRSRTIDEDGLRALAWRQGTPLGEARERVEFHVAPEPGDSYYARVAWTDGNLAWTSPIRVRPKEESE